MKVDMVQVLIAVMIICAAIAATNGIKEKEPTGEAVPESFFDGSQGQRIDDGSGIAVLCYYNASELYKHTKVNQTGNFPPDTTHIPWTINTIYTLRGLEQNNNADSILQQMKRPDIQAPWGDTYEHEQTMGIQFAGCKKVNQSELEPG